MKINLTILAVIFLSLQAYSQSKNTISVAYGIASNNININGAIGDFGYHSKTGTIWGVNYSRSFSKLFSIESGLTFSNDKVELHSILPASSNTTNGNIKMISVPAIGKFTFLRYLYADLGLTIDFQTNYTGSSPAPDQSGIGIEGGIGGQYNIGRVRLFINPFFQRHSAIGFKSNQSNYNLSDTGVKFGAGYNF